MTAARLWGTAVRAIGLVVAGVLLWASLIGTRWPALYYMTGPSMEPTVTAGELFLTWSPPGDLSHGQLIIFEFTDADGEDFHVMRRLVGLPYDTMAMIDGALTVNGQPTPWPFRVLARHARTSPYARVADLYTWRSVVPADSVFVLSDTRDHLGWPDSRFIGPVPRAAVIAVAARTISGRSLAVPDRP